MSQRTDVLRERAAAERRRLTEVFDTLEDEVDDLVDWRRYVQREPAAAMGFAVAAGVIAGALSAPRRRSSPSRPSLLRKLSEGVAGGHPDSLLRKAAPWMLELLGARALAYLAQRTQKRERTESGSPAP